MDAHEAEKLVRRIEQSKSEETAEKYIQKATQFQKWLQTEPPRYTKEEGVRHKDLEDAGVVEIEKWLEELNDEYAESTVQLSRSALVAVYDALNALIAAGEIDGEDWGDKTPADIAEVPTSRWPDGDQGKDVAYLDPEDVYRVAEETTRLRDELLILLLFQTGIRVTELCELQLSDLDSEAQSIAIRGDGARKRTVRYQESLAVPLETWLSEHRPEIYHAADSEFLFPTTQSAQISGQTVRHIIRRAAEDAGVQPIAKASGQRTAAHNVTPRVLRHSFAMAVLDNGWSLEKLQRTLGHEHISTTAALYSDDDDVESGSKGDEKPPLGL